MMAQTPSITPGDSCGHVEWAKDVIVIKKYLDLVLAYLKTNFINKNIKR
jgi:hypothetical protein